MRNILITGGAKRIGAEIIKMISCFEFKKNIIIHYHQSQREAERLKENFSNQWSNIFLFQADLTKYNEILSLIQFSKERLNSIDILINNASIFQKDSFASDDDSYLTNYSNIHLTAPFLLAKFVMNSQVQESCLQDSLLQFSQKNKIILNMLDARRCSNDNIKNYGEYFYYSMTKHMMFILHQYLQKECMNNQSVRIFGLMMNLILPNKNDAEYFEQNQINTKSSNEKILEILKIMKEIFMGDLNSRDFEI